MAKSNAVSKSNESVSKNLPEVKWPFELNGRRDPRLVVEGITHKSAAIRALAAANFTPSEIVKLSHPDPKKGAGENALSILQYTKEGRLQIELRYQHVNNVLKQPLKAPTEVSA